MKKETKQFLLHKYAERFIRENKAFLSDYRKLCEELLLFRARWGIEIGFIFKNSKEVKGRELGVGIIEELFDAQKMVNKKI